MDERRPELLFLCQNLPYPPDGGAQIRSFHTLRLLSSAFEVTALCFFRRRTRPDREAIRRGIEGLGTFARVEAFPIPQEWSRARFVADHLRSLIARGAYTRWAYDSSAFRSCLGRFLDEHDFSVVHVDSLDLVAYLPMLGRLPRVVAHHNVESQLLRRRAESEPGWRAVYLRHQAALTRREEKRWCADVDLNVVVSAEDRDTLRQVASDARYLVIPNGVDTSEFRPAPPGPRSGIVFVGGYTWFPNRDGMNYFVERILPLIRREAPDAEVTWVGRASSDVRTEFARRGVHMTGYVDDIRPYVDPAACFIVPLRVGGGTRLKILDAWALGKAVVSTTQGCEGLNARDGSNIAVADSPEAFARAVLGLLRDPELRRRLEEGARKTVEQEYDWEILREKMIRSYRDLLRTGTS